VAHYTTWSFSLYGDRQKLKKLVRKPSKELIDPQERAIVQGFTEDVKTINKVDRLVCIARHTHDVFRKTGNIPAGKMVVINNALEDTYKQLSLKKKSEIKKKYYLDNNTRIILFAGRLDEVKGIAWLIRAFRKVLQTNPDIRLLIAGEGNFNEWLKESADIWSRIIFTGRIEKEKLFELYQIADMGVVCSLHEEFGLVAIEMMMHELPIIVTKTGGLDEIVEEKISGLKAPVRTLKGKRQADVNKLAINMRFLLDNPDYAEKLGQNGRKRFLEKYELSLFRKKMMNLYENL
jgi:glycosyltransferase